MTSLPKLPPLPSEWVLDANRNPPVYTRLMIGSELFKQKRSISSDGQILFPMFPGAVIRLNKFRFRKLNRMGDVCFGVILTSSLDTGEMRDRARRAVDQLRFVCPIIASTMERDGDTLRWVYTPSADREAWLNLAFSVEERGASLNPTEFVKATNLKLLPYEDGKGMITHFRVYLLTTSNERNDNRKEFGLYMHGPHSMLEAGPAMHGVNLMCEWMSGKGTGVTIRPSEEWKNLPVDPITATGGPLKEWATSGRELLDYYTEQKERTAPHICLPPPPRPLDTSKPLIRRTITLSKAETAAIIAQTKKLSISVTALFYAANVLAQYKMNPIVEAGNEIDFAYDLTTVSLDRYTKPPVDPRKHMISYSTTITLRFSMARALSEPTEKGRLIMTARTVQERLDKYLGNPCLPQLAAVTATMVPGKVETARTQKNPWQCRVVNMGVMEKRVKMDHGPIALESITLGSRRGTLVGVHIWTMHSEMHFQVQGAAAWGEECLKTVLEETVRIGSLIVDKPLGKL